ncbi:class I SAM-dependent methyltransferase [Aliifodinibius sp. S!AR15-10]|uniref:class I SAM-dependent methyltransferase n=1 Tax=Aliifodinibius sp. S!AR15-10 TaxID=2950437 RepID=UPI0028586E7D|nr:class I SAM-dependent methyltransferase [Aliifodinibius sp. S!AR15-10]MDR8392840.1 class I SAM-dependent methyltransferase [Aliifodinibius sp. S!AR15-10]
MADKQDLDFTYSTIDRIFRLSLGEMADFSGAMYNGNFSMTLEQAQEAKHRFIVKQLNITPESRVLDMGCGWGPLVNYITNEVGARCIGLTLSDAQAEACRKNGLEVYIKNCLEVTSDDYGTFNAVASLGAFEHFCSVEEYKSGKQEEVYRRFFRTVYDLLPTGGRMYLQTMVFGKNMIDYEDIDINAEKGSDAYILALMEKQFPGSWLPYGSEMVIECAEPLFKLISKSSGRLDYIETIRQWEKRYRSFNLKKYAFLLALLPKYLTDINFRALLSTSPNRICFEREIFDHYRMVFEKTD